MDTFENIWKQITMSIWLSMTFDNRYFNIGYDHNGITWDLNCLSPCIFEKVKVQFRNAKKLKSLLFFVKIAYTPASLKRSVNEFNLRMQGPRISLFFLYFFSKYFNIGGSAYLFLWFIFFTFFRHIFRYRRFFCLTHISI